MRVVTAMQAVVGATVMDSGQSWEPLHDSFRYSPVLAANVVVYELQCDAARYNSVASQHRAAFDDDDVNDDSMVNCGNNVISREP